AVLTAPEHRRRRPLVREPDRERVEVEGQADGAGHPVRVGYAAVIPYHRFDGPDDAPVLVLSNSLGTTHEMWEPQLDALTRHFRVLRYDRRGHGRSEVRPGPYTVPELAGDVIELLNAL